MDPAPPDPLPSTVRVVRVLDLGVLADADIRRLHMGFFGKDHAWWYLKPLIGAAVPHPPPMQAAVQGSKVEVFADLPSSVPPLVMRASGKARGGPLPALDRHGRGLPAPRVRAVVQAATGAPRPSPEVWKTLAEDQELHSMFARLVDGGPPGNVGV